MRWAGDLTRPAVVMATAVLVMNDHVLKGAGVLPGGVTGKLSDVAGLFVAGVLAVTVVRAAGTRIWGGRVSRKGWAAAASLVAVGVGFAALKMWPAFNEVVARVWGHNVLDPTDLYALPMLLVAWAWLADREQRSCVPPRQFSSSIGLLAVVLACAATPAPPPKPPPPVAGWTVGQAARNLRCGVATAWVVKSGKTGFAVSLNVAPGENGCALEITSARVRFPTGEVIEGQPIALPPPHGPYVIFPFDNNARWNGGERASIVELELSVDGVSEQWALPAKHVYHHYPPGYR